MGITREQAQRFGNAKCWVVFEKKLQLFTAFTLLQQHCSNYCSVKFEKTRLLALVKLRTPEQTFKWLLVGWAMIRNCWGSLCWDNWSRRYLASKRNYTVWKCYLSNFTKIKLLIINRDNSIGLLNYIVMFFIKELARLRNFLFVCCLACHTEIVETIAVYPPPTRAP